MERSEAIVGEHTCHCGLTGLTRDELDQHMQKAHGAPPFTREGPFDDKPMPGATGIGDAETFAKPCAECGSAAGEWCRETDGLVSRGLLHKSRILARAPGIASPAAIEELGLAGSCRAATLDAFVTAARSLKAADEAYRAAQQAYAEAVKRLSEEAVR